MSCASNTYYWCSWKVVTVGRQQTWRRLCDPTRLVGEITSLSVSWTLASWLATILMKVYQVNQGDRQSSFTICALSEHSGISVTGSYRRLCIPRRTLWRYTNVVLLWFPSYHRSDSVKELTVIIRQPTIPIILLLSSCQLTHRLKNTTKAFPEKKNIPHNPT